VATKFNEVFSGYQLCQVSVRDVSLLHDCSKETSLIDT
jgi:hypothetical protein